MVMKVVLFVVGHRARAGESDLRRERTLCEHWLCVSERRYGPSVISPSPGEGRACGHPFCTDGEVEAWPGTKVYTQGSGASEQQDLDLTWRDVGTPTSHSLPPQRKAVTRSPGVTPWAELGCPSNQTDTVGPQAPRDRRHR